MSRFGCGGQEDGSDASLRRQRRSHGWTVDVLQERRGQWGAFTRTSTLCLHIREPGGGDWPGYYTARALDRGAASSHAPRRMLTQRTPQRWSRGTLRETTLKKLARHSAKQTELPQSPKLHKTLFLPTLSLSLSRSLPEQRCFRPKTYDHSAVETTRCIIMLQRRKLHKVIIKIQERRNEKVPNIQYKKQTTRSTLVRRLCSLQIDGVWRIGGGLERGVKQ